MTAGDNDVDPRPAGATATRLGPPITLRDYFAASALQGLTTRRPAGVPTSATELARFAFEIADAMLAVRGK
jgi:hypothetical protein